jgi:hypothetical protein
MLGSTSMTRKGVLPWHGVRLRIMQIAVVLSSCASRVCESRSPFGHTLPLTIARSMELPSQPTSSRSAPSYDQGACARRLASEVSGAKYRRQTKGCQDRDPARASPAPTVDATRKLCPECFAAMTRAAGGSLLSGF